MCRFVVTKSPINRIKIRASSKQRAAFRGDKSQSKRREIACNRSLVYTGDLKSRGKSPLKSH